MYKFLSKGLIGDEKQMKRKLLKAKLRGEVSQTDYEEANAEFRG
jgi:hypothetical protein